MSKSTTIPSEILNIFSEKRRSAILGAFCKLLESLNLDSQTLGGNKRHNCKLTNCNKLLTITWYYRLLY